MSASSNANDTAKSTSVDSTAASGTTSLGKYTLVISPALPTRLFADPLNDDANTCQGRSAASVNNGYGKPSEGRPASRPKMIVNSTIVISGCSTAHAIPSVVCL